MAALDNYKWWCVMIGNNEDAYIMKCSPSISGDPTKEECVKFLTDTQTFVEDGYTADKITKMCWVSGKEAESVFKPAMDDWDNYPNWPTFTK